MDNMPMQTLQIYRKKEKVPLDIQIKKMTDELQSIKINFPRRYPKKIKPKALPIDEPTIRSIEWQDLLGKIERDLWDWIQDYRDMIDKLRELDRIIPKTEHDLQKSDEEAQENVDKIIKVEDLKEQILAEFKIICIQYEDNDKKLKRRIKQLDSQLLGSQAKIDNLEYQLKRKQKAAECESTDL